MLLLVFALKLAAVVSQEIAKERPYIVFPVPFELPNRNDRSDQCWLRIEDIELTETISIYCFIAHAFLKDHLYEYNKKSSKDLVDLDFWTETRKEDETGSRNLGYANYQKLPKTWKSTTVMDPIIHYRIYVTPKADCRIIMYNREATSNYRVDCEGILYMVNDKMPSKAMLSREIPPVLLVFTAFFVCLKICSIIII